MLDRVVKEYVLIKKQLKEAALRESSRQYLKLWDCVKSPGEQVQKGEQRDAPSSDSMALHRSEVEKVSLEQQLRLTKNRWENRDGCVPGANEGKTS